MKKNVIIVKNVSKKIGKKSILKKVSLNVLRGHVHAFIGLNGAGKTTLIKSILNQINFHGAIFLDHKNNKLISSKKDIGYIPSKLNFPPKISLLKYLTYIGYIGGLSMKCSRIKCELLLKKYDIYKYAKKSPNSLSSGEHKKVMLIQALINDPKILIMDEPTSHLDLISTMNFFNEIKSLAANNNMTIFLSTHKFFEIEQFCDSLTMIHEGKIIYTGDKNKWIGNNNILETFVSALKAKKSVSVGVK